MSGIICGPLYGDHLRNCTVRAKSIAVVYKCTCFSSHSRNAEIVTFNKLKRKRRNFQVLRSIKSISYSSGDHYKAFSKYHLLRVERLKLWTSFHSALPRSDLGTSVNQVRLFVALLRYLCVCSVCFDSELNLLETGNTCHKGIFCYSPYTTLSLCKLDFSVANFSFDACCEMARGTCKMM